MTVIADSSPFIAMGRIGRLDILHAVFDRLLVPDAVWKEVVEVDGGRPGSIEITEASWIERRTIKDFAWANALKGDLGAGESEAIVLARETKADFVLMDELMGRSVAQRLGLRVVGLVGVLIEGRKNGLITNAPEIMDRLGDEAGFCISEELRRLVTE